MTETTFSGQGNGDSPRQTGDFSDMDGTMVDNRNSPRHLHRLNSNQSNASIFEDVEMAQDEVCVLETR